MCRVYANSFPSWQTDTMCIPHKRAQACIMRTNLMGCGSGQKWSLVQYHMFSLDLMFRNSTGQRGCLWNFRRKYVTHRDETSNTWLTRDNQWETEIWPTNIQITARFNDNDEWREHLPCELCHETWVNHVCYSLGQYDERLKPAIISFNMFAQYDGKQKRSSHWWVMHVGIAKVRWRGKHSRHSRHMRNPQI